MTSTILDHKKNLVSILSQQLDALKDNANVKYSLSIVAKKLNAEAPSEKPSKYSEESIIAAETVGSDLLRRSTGEPLEDLVNKTVLEKIYRIRRAGTFTGGIDLSKVLETVLSGLIIHKQPEIRYFLSTLNLSEASTSVSQWSTFLKNEIFRGILLLVRKKDGYEDIKEAKKIVQELRTKQAANEQQFLETFDLSERQIEGRKLVAWYSLAKALEITASYLLGENRNLSKAGVSDDIQKYMFNALEVIGYNDFELRHVLRKIEHGFLDLIESSIYSVVASAAVKRALSSLADHNAESPILELWHAQKRAIQSSLLDPTKLAVVVSLPTSAGKTLLAKLSILQSINDLQDHKVIYLAPTRALVNQIALSLKKDFASSGIKVQIANPIFELDPMEDQVLQQDYHVLVTTPEKCDLLFRVSHPSVEKVSLVVVDEAHNINDSHRGGKLELLLSQLRRERSQIRYLLLTPFASNAQDVASWLGGRDSAPIVVDWKPNDRIIGQIVKGRRVSSADKFKLDFQTLESPHSDCPSGKVIKTDIEVDFARKDVIAASTVLRLHNSTEGGILVLSNSRSDAEENAAAVASSLPMVSNTKIELICRYLDAEVGGVHPLTSVLRKGVAFHHAGLSPEARYFVERLIEDKCVRVICATTTLAQGVHFPLSAAVIESYNRKIRTRSGWITQPIEPWEFWNIAGRVGRTLEDSLGLVAFIGNSPDQKRNIKRFLRNDANTIKSVMTDLVTRMQSNDGTISFSLGLIDRHPAVSAFLQYILHAISVSESSLDSDIEVENLLRSSFFFSELKRNDVESANSFVRVAREYVAFLKEKKGNTLVGFSKLADSTGFSSPSVDFLFADWKGTSAPEITDWNAGNLFPSGGTASAQMIKVAESLSRVPEVKLGSEEGGEFNPERIARIISKWVNGESMQAIANQEYQNKVLDCSKHIYANISTLVPWGLRAIQRVAFSGRTEAELTNLELLPAMVFHGVKSKEAIAMRMNNVPRIAAEGLGSKFKANTINLPDMKVDEWIAGLSASDWGGALSQSSPINGEDTKKIWEVLDGRRKWKDI